MILETIPLNLKTLPTVSETYLGCPCFAIKLRGKNRYQDKT